MLLTYALQLTPGTVDPRCSLSLNIIVEWLALLLHIQEVPHTIFSLKASYCDRPSCGFPNCLHIKGPIAAWLVEALCYKLEGCGSYSWWGHWICSIYIILPAHYGPGVNSASNRNEYQESLLWEKRNQRVRMINSLPSASQLSRKCGILNVSHPNGPTYPVIRIALLYLHISILK
jgi:hypothetical protein